MTRPHILSRQREAVDNRSDRPGENLAKRQDVNKVFRLIPGH